MSFEPSRYFLFLLMLCTWQGAGSLHAQDYETIPMTIHPEDQVQKVVGFGASLAYYESWLNAHPRKAEIYEAIFGELSLDILRVRNAFDYDSTMIDRVAEYMQAAEASLGHPIDLLSTSWGPPGYLKNTGDRKNGGTLRYTVEEGSVLFDYAGFAQWWNGSLDEYNEKGIIPKYISIQNEPDFSADWESCLLRPSETVNASDTIAGYNLALDAVYDTIMQRDHRPQILGPETVGIGYNSVENYVNALDTSKLEGIAHHLYHGVDENNPYSSTDFAKVGNLFPEIPHFQSEYSRGDWFSLAGLIYKSFHDENVVAYLYWDLIWNEGGLVTVEFPWDPSRWTDPQKGYIKTKDFFAFKQFSAFVHPGWLRLDLSQMDNRVAALGFTNPGGDSLTCVMVNRSGSDSIAMHLSIPGFRVDGSAIHVTSEIMNCEPAGALVDSLLILPPHSIVTVQMVISEYTPFIDTNPPTIPVGLEAMSVSGSSISINWNPSMDDVGVAGYRIFVDGEFYGTTMQTSYMVTSLEPGTTYSISVSAFDDAENESARSAAIEVTTAYPDIEAPSVPINLQISAATQLSITIVWDPSQDNVGVAGYHIYANGLKIGTAFINSYTLTGLNPGITYEISVSAFDEAGNESGQSDPVSGSTYIEGVVESGIGGTRFYPNPFTRSATLEYSTSTKQEIWMSITDARGRVLSQMYLGNIPPGNNRVIIKRDKLGAGLYLIRLHNTVGEESSFRILIID